MLAIIRKLEYNNTNGLKAELYMLYYISAKEAAEKWNISQRRVAVLCAEKRIEGAMMVGNVWIIPSEAEKPVDKRTTRYEETRRKELKPFVKWVGGKSQLVEELEKYILSSKGVCKRKYAEPMVGGGALFFDVLARYSFEEYYISDVNPELINAYNVIRGKVEPLIERLQDMQMTFLPMDASGRKYFYYSLREKFNRLSLRSDTALEKAADFIFLNKTCFNGLYRVNRKGLFNVPMGSYKNPKICDEENLRDIHEALQKVEIVCGDYTLSKSFIDEDTFVYLDPPYRPISETSAFTSYNRETFDDEEQRRLAAFIKEITDMHAKVVLSNSDPKNINEEDNFFDELYQGYQIKRVSASRMINCNAERRGKIKELIICNQEE